MSLAVRMGGFEVLGSVDSDADLWNALNRADEGAFRELFLRHSDGVYNYCFRHTASWSAAEDAVQATFAALWRRAVAGTVEELRLDSARPVLLAMARNACSNANRSRDRQLALVDRMRVAPRDAVDDAGRWVESETTMQLIRQALSVLPANQREVVELVAWSELSMAAAAAVLHVSVGTVKSRLFRARARLASSPIAGLLGELR
jgi:RNA polymerase sigma factor (sigma-70 family)